MSLPRYPKYQATDLKWLHEAPAHWAVKPNKAFLEPRKSTVGESWSTKILLSLTLNGVIPRDTESGKGKFPADFGTYQDVAKNDVVFCLFDLDETPRTVGLARESGMITAAYDVFRCKAGADPRFVFYFYLHVDEFKGLRPFYTGLRKVVRPPTFMAIKIPLPPLDEQMRIAEFLDRETAKIDGLVAEQRRLMELLKEKRQAIISHAVTHGLNPKAPLKPSGIEWLGDVPMHWAVKKLRYLCDVQTGGRDTEHAIEEGKYPFFVRSQEIERIDSMTFDCEAVLTAGDGAGVGKVFHYYKGPFDFHQRVYMMNNFREVSGLFFFHYLRENFFKVALEGGAKSTVDSLRRPMFTNFPICVPPPTEQVAIVEHITAETAKFDTLTAEAQRAIDLLQERRTALISAAVTGQIDVRNT